MTTWTRMAPAILLAACLAACEPVPKGPAQDFVAATTALAQAESDYFDQIQAASDASHVLLGSESYVLHIGSFETNANELVKRDDFSKAKAARMAAMAQLQNYAKQIAAITAAADGTWIADDAKANVTSVASLLKDSPAHLALTSQQTGLLQTAVGDLANAIIAAKTARELKSLAMEAKQPIADIATMIKLDTDKIETDDYASGLVMDQTKAMMLLLRAIYEDHNANSGNRLDAVLAWRDFKPVLITKGRDINDALAKLIKANDELAAQQPLHAGDLAQQAFAAAQQALGITSGGK